MQENSISAAPNAPIIDQAQFEADKRAVYKWVHDFFRHSMYANKTFIQFYCIAWGFHCSRPLIPKPEIFSLFEQFASTLVVISKFIALLCLMSEVFEFECSVYAQRMSWHRAGEEMAMKRKLCVRFVGASLFFMRTLCAISYSKIHFIVIYDFFLVSLRRVCVCIDTRPGSLVYSCMCWCRSADRRVGEVAKKCTWASEIHVCIEHLFTIAHASLHWKRESKSCTRVLCRNNRIFDVIFETCMTIKCKRMLVILLRRRRRLPLLLHQ